MEKIAAYQAAILDLLQECHETFPPTDGIENQLIIDRENHHYLFMPVGFFRDRRFYGPLVHFDIKDGQIWIQVNNTEIEVDKALMRRGVPEADIEIGFHRPGFRELAREMRREGYS